ncbi:FAD:protein FMN transferase [Bacteroidia bacterium]|nr:FAD:protein FMN transferase [Bacteroidia bacterium]
MKIGSKIDTKNTKNTVMAGLTRHDMQIVKRFFLGWRVKPAMTGILPLIVMNCCVCLLFSCTKQPPWYLTQGEIFHTTAHFKYLYHKDLGAEIFARLDSFDWSLNPYNKQSIIYKVNHNEAVEVDDWFITVFNRAQAISRLTGGYYDITCAPLVNLWGFGFEKSDTVTPQMVDSILQFVGYQKVWLDGRKVVKSDPRVQLDMSSIAKGYAVDVVAELLDGYGIADYMVEIGGEVRTKGANPEGKGWCIEILKPIDDVSGAQQEFQKAVALEDYSLATSGNYRNFYVKDGKKIAHTINPLTGYPVVETLHAMSLLSVSILYPDCMTADAFATACMTLGMEKARALADSIPHLDYLFIYSDASGNLQEQQSRNFERYIVVPY